MATKDEITGHSGAAPYAPASPEEFAKGLERRRQAAHGLEQDLLTEVPLLYGSPGSMEPQGDPGVVIARLHREALLRRHGVGAPNESGKRSDAVLPFERAMEVLAILLALFFLFGS